MLHGGPCSQYGQKPRLGWAGGQPRVKKCPQCYLRGSRKGQFTPVLLREKVPMKIILQSPLRGLPVQTTALRSKSKITTGKQAKWSQTRRDPCQWLCHYEQMESYDCWHKWDLSTLGVWSPPKITEVSLFDFTQPNQYKTMDALGRGRT